MGKENGYVDTPVYKRQQLTIGQELAGPAIIEEYGSSTVVFPGDRVVVSELGHLIIHLNMRRDQ